MDLLHLLLTVSLENQKKSRNNEGGLQKRFCVEIGVALGGQIRNIKKNKAH